MSNAPFRELFVELSEAALKAARALGERTKQKQAEFRDYTYLIKQAYAHEPPRFRRPPRETYVRTSRPTTGGDFVEPGVEYRDGDHFGAIEDALRQMLVDHDPGRDVHDPVRIAAPVEAAIKERWPDRAYFVEVHGEDGWIQIFQPFGVPRNQP